VTTPTLWVVSDKWLLTLDAVVIIVPCHFTSRSLTSTYVTRRRDLNDLEWQLNDMWRHRTDRQTRRCPPANGTWDVTRQCQPTPVNSINTIAIILTRLQRYLHSIIKTLIRVALCMQQFRAQRAISWT